MLCLVPSCNGESLTPWVLGLCACWATWIVFGHPLNVDLAFCQHQLVSPQTSRVAFCGCGRMVAWLVALLDLVCLLGFGSRPCRVGPACMRGAEILVSDLLFPNVNTNNRFNSMVSGVTLGYPAFDPQMYPFIERRPRFMSSQGHDL